MLDTLLAKALDALPNPVFLYDRELRIQHANQAALRFSEEQELANAVTRRPGDALKCVNARRGPSGCGASEACKSCVLRHSVEESLITQTVVRRSSILQREAPWGTDVRHLQVLVSPFDFEGRLLALVEFVDESELVELRALLPVCPRCGAVRCEGAWKERVEEYFEAHPDAVGGALCEKCRVEPREPQA
ncbi:MAG: PAS domain-containing protein [Myxococcales bacterium]